MNCITNSCLAICLVVLFVGVLADCPDGFVTHGANCYHFSHDLETWVDAMTACERLFEARIVEIEDSTENDYLIREATRLGGPFWTAGNDLQVEGEWMWFYSREPMSLATWSPGNPSNSNHNENCMELHDGYWNDDQCSAFRKYICERNLEDISEIAGKR